MTHLRVPRFGGRAHPIPGRLVWRHLVTPLTRAILAVAAIAGAALALFPGATP